jgi:hypothetical protein
MLLVRLIPLWQCLGKTKEILTLHFILVYD